MLAILSFIGTFLVVHEGEGRTGFSQEFQRNQAYLLGCHGFDGLSLIVQGNGVQTAGGLFADGLCLFADVVSCE